jgi:hypothetical protein
MTGIVTPNESDDNLSTEAREMAAWQAMAASNQQYGVGDELYDEDFAAMRSEL